MELQKRRRMPDLIAVLIIILLLLGYSGYRSVREMNSVSGEMHAGSYHISGLILRINTGVTVMHYNMEIMRVAPGGQDQQTYLANLAQAEQGIRKNMAELRELWQGQPDSLQHILQLFDEWEELRADILAQLAAGNDVLALYGQCTAKADEIHTGLLQMLKANQKLIMYEEQKAQGRALSSLHFFTFSFALAVLLSGVIFVKAVNLEKELREHNQSLELKVQERTSKLLAANAKVNAMNEALEERVAERTAELQASYDELKSVEETIRIQLNIVQETQNALANERLLTDALFDSVPGLLYLYDDQGDLRRWNKRHEDITGFTAEELQSKNVFAWYQQDQEAIQAIEAARQRALLQGFAELEINLRTKKGLRRMFYLTLVPLALNGKMHFAGIGIDIEERKQAEQTMQQALDKAETANQAKSQFLANMSHEIRTPMNGIIGMTDLALMTDLDEQQKDYLTVVKASTMALLRVLNDILDYAKMEAGKVQLEKYNFNLRQIIKEVIDLFAVGARQKGLELTVQIAENVPKQVLGDFVRLRQVLSNLVGNGIKFTYCGFVRITVDLLQQQQNKVTLKFTVQDTGIGICRGEFDKLFKGFSQVDGSNTRKFGGSGLGLAISQKMVEIMNGEIWVESQENVGSSFSFTAVFEVPGQPAGDKALDSRADNAALSKIADGNAVKQVLLADDDLISRNVVSILLERLGCTVTIAENGLEAVEAFDEKQFDLVLMDVNMPYIDGFTATAFIRSKEQPLQRRTPVVAITAYALQGDREKCLAAGMDDYISKPINLKESMDIIAKYL